MGFASNPFTFFLRLVIPAGPRGRLASSCKPPPGPSSVRSTNVGICQPAQNRYPLPTVDTWHPDHLCAFIHLLGQEFQVPREVRMAAFVLLTQIHVKQCASFTAKWRPVFTLLRAVSKCTLPFSCCWLLKTKSWILLFCYLRCFLWNRATMLFWCSIIPYLPIHDRLMFLHRRKKRSSFSAKTSVS